MKVQSLILYGSHKKLTNAHKLVTVGTHPPNGANPQPTYYIRAKVCAGDIADALSKARPMIGETVLNTVPVNP